MHRTCRPRTPTPVIPLSHGIVDVDCCLWCHNAALIESVQVMQDSEQTPYGLVPPIRS